jgi:uroporphyrinogen-III synthase
VRLLVTRPEPDAQRTAASLRAGGHEAIVAPLMRIEAAADADLGSGPWAAILITSANAARAIALHGRIAELRAVPLFAVGRRSAEAARGAGFAEVIAAEGDVRDLADLVATRIAPRATLLYLAGETRAGDLAQELAQFAVRMVVVYRAVGIAALPPAAMEALDGLDGVVHFSRRTAELYVSAARLAGRLEEALAPLHFCLSAQVAEAVAAAGATNIRVASRPEEAALIELVDSA